MKGGEGKIRERRTLTISSEVHRLLGLIKFKYQLRTIDETILFLIDKSGVNGFIQEELQKIYKK